uniref:Putative nuclease HARBI1 n=1 Tax=Meloidogyne floridensis TaxID=298350 RepID=A0A915NY89_9BILA
MELKVLKKKDEFFDRFSDKIEKLVENALKRNFYSYCRLPFTVGAIDGTHIRIVAPEIEDERSYVNRKNFHSLNVMAICSANNKFLHISASWPGSCHDSHVLRQSPVWDFFEAGNAGNSIILGDTGYPLRKWLMVPFNNPTTDSQKKFNRALCKGRSRIEHTFGMFKRRFSINHTGYRINLEQIPTAITACAVLHNIAIDRRLPIIGDEFDDNQPDMEIFQENNRSLGDRRIRIEAIKRRNEIVARFE